MCECYQPCTPKRRKPRSKPKVFNALLLDCWQREYDKRPYSNFVFKQLEFEERLGRAFHPINDFEVILEFLHTRKLNSVTIIGTHATTKLSSEKRFAAGLLNVRKLHLKMMQLPDCFFDQLICNVDKMRIEEFILHGIPLTFIELVDLRRFLIESKTLRSLNLTDCSIKQCDFAIVADGVHKSTSIRRVAFNRLLGGGLTLDSQNIAHTISSLLWQNKLEALEIQKCELLAQDMETLAEYMYSPCSKLRVLDVACNLIATDGAEYLFRAIANSGTLTHLNMSCCGLGHHGGEVVAKYLCNSFNLMCLNITYNDIAAETVNLILTTWKKRIDQLSIKLWGNQFNDKSGKILNRLLKSRVLPRDCIDITATYDEDLEYYRIVPYF